MSDEATPPENESAAAAAERIFESQRLAETTAGPILQACESVSAVFLDDESRIRAAHAIADGIPAGISADAARRIVMASLRDPALAPFLKPAHVGPAPGSLEAIKAGFEARKAAAAAPPPPPAGRPKTLEEMGEAIRARRNPLLYPEQS